MIIFIFLQVNCCFLYIFALTLRLKDVYDADYASWEEGKGRRLKDEYRTPAAQSAQSL